MRLNVINCENDGIVNTYNSGRYSMKEICGYLLDYSMVSRIIKDSMRYASGCPLYYLLRKNRIDKTFVCFENQHYC